MSRVGSCGSWSKWRRRRASTASVLETVVEKARFWMQHASDQLNARQLKALNRMLDADAMVRGGMTNKKYASLTRASPATAQRDLSDLVGKRCLTLIAKAVEPRTTSWQPEFRQIKGRQRTNHSARCSRFN